MTSPVNSDSETGLPASWNLDERSRSFPIDKSGSSSIQDMSVFLRAYLDNSILSRPSWSQDEVSSIVSAYLGLMSANNWASLGNSSDLMDRVDLERFFGALGFAYQDDLHVKPSSSTAISAEPSYEVGRLMENIFSAARNEVFEDGMESQFSKELVSLIWKHGQVAILEAARLIASEKVDPIVAAEALKWVGRINDGKTHSFRLWLLKRGLTSSNAQVRDGAGLGLSFLGDPEAIQALSQAASIEQSPELKSDLKQIIEQLSYAA